MELIGIDKMKLTPCMVGRRALVRNSEAWMHKAYFIKGCCPLQIILLLVLIPTLHCCITVCGRSGIILYIFVITIEFFIIY